jgi:hypothetical protein
VAVVAVCAAVAVVGTIMQQHMSQASQMREHARNMRLKALGLPIPLSASGPKSRSGPPGMAVLTPDTARELLRLPEKDQELLVLKPRTLSQEVMQARILQHLHSENEGEGGEHEHGHPDAALQMEAPHHTTTPAQEKAERQWALIFVTAIVTASVTFETLKEITEENTPPTMIKVVEKFFAELATLGFIGTIAFVMVSQLILGCLSLETRP